MLKQRSQAALPPGEHEGKIISCRETTRDFGRGEEPKVEVVIGPDWKQDATTETIPVSVLFSPILNRISGLSQFLARLGVKPAEGTVWEPTSIDGKRIRFVSTVDENGFVKVDKRSIRTV